MMSRLIAILFTVLLLNVAVPALASEEGPELPRQHWSFQGIFGTYDRAALQRGYKVYSHVCSACHSMKRVYFRNLADLGYNDAEIKAIAANYTAVHGLTDDGEPKEEKALPSDHFPSPFPNAKAAASVNNGAVPPDMSLLAKAREGGADYIYAIVTGFQDPPEDANLLPGQYWNKYMPGHLIAMAPPLSDGQVAYEDGTPETVSQYAMDVAQFLEWAAEPKMEARKRVGIKVFLFLLVFTGLMYAVKKKVWADAH